MNRTTRYVLLKVHVLHEAGTDPAVICGRAVFGYDDMDGAVEGAELVCVSSEKEIEAGNPGGPTPPKMNRNRVAALIAMMQDRRQ